MTVKVQRMCNSRIDRNVVGGVRFESVRITIHNSTFEVGGDDFSKYAKICTQLFNPMTPECNILAEIIHMGIQDMYMLAKMDEERNKTEEAGQ